MEYTITEKREKKIQVTFPSFVQFGEVYYKIPDNKKVIVVTDYSFSKVIEIGSSSHHLPFGTEGWEFITEDIFNAAYHRVLKELTELNIPV